MTQSGKPTRVGLLTLPLSNNYGGILQMIALYEVLKQEGYEPVLIDKRARYRTLREQILDLLGKIPMQNLRGARGRALIARRHRSYFESLVDERTAPVWTSQDIEKELQRLGISTVVVGSDQVWRLGYQKDAAELNYFLNFGSADMRRVSYAASFGYSVWPDLEKTDDIRACLARFNAISVREESGRTICAETFKRDDAQRVLDPTLLLDPDYYRKLIEPRTAPPGVLAYVLDREEETRKLAQEIAVARGNLPVRFLSPEAQDFTGISDWLAEFANAEFVVTDSFHGTIFSILFRKPFLTLMNSRRGVDRFTTLFDTFGLTDRGLMDWVGGLPPVVATDPDFDEIASTLEEQRETSRNFLRIALKT